MNVANFYQASSDSNRDLRKIGNQSPRKFRMVPGLQKNPMSAYNKSISRTAHRLVDVQGVVKMLAGFYQSSDNTNPQTDLLPCNAIRSMILHPKGQTCSHLVVRLRVDTKESQFWLSSFSYGALCDQISLR
jgi:hypothetical protein